MDKGKQVGNSPIKSHHLVFKALQQAGHPVSAYGLLADLRSQGVTAPPTVYRALNRLIQQGRVHRIESLNAYVACSGGHSYGRAGFAICDGCGEVSEFQCREIRNSVDGRAREMAFEVADLTLEMRGKCASCAVSGKTD